jgi:hypothetical protein
MVDVQLEDGPAISAGGVFGSVTSRAMSVSPGPGNTACTRMPFLQSSPERL